MSAKEQLVKNLKFYWEMRNGKFREQLRPVAKFLVKYLRKHFPRGSAPHIIRKTSPVGTS
jgi:hypothetical protein